MAGPVRRAVAVAQLELAERLAEAFPEVGAADSRRSAVARLMEAMDVDEAIANLILDTSLGVATEDRRAAIRAEIDRFDAE